jgi:lipoprotein NlpD
VVKQTQATSPAFTSKVIWTWPTKGRVVANFAPSAGRQGIDISGENGQAVLASSSGEVVYVGNGLKGYGNLVIVKHNEEYLSAYAHNKETFVREGQRINTGYRIASLGKNKLKSNVLHFQIRQHGKPVDPKKYLPND